MAEPKPTKLHSPATLQSLAIDSVCRLVFVDLVDQLRRHAATAHIDDVRDASALDAAPFAAPVSAIRQHLGADIIAHVPRSFALHEDLRAALLRWYVRQSDPSRPITMLLCQTALDGLTEPPRNLDMATIDGYCRLKAGGVLESLRGGHPRIDGPMVEAVLRSVDGAQLRGLALWRVLDVDSDAIRQLCPRLGLMRLYGCGPIRRHLRLDGYERCRLTCTGDKRPVKLVKELRGHQSAAGPSGASSSSSSSPHGVHVRLKSVVYHRRPIQSSLVSNDILGLYASDSVYAFK